jgi:hypothetical protein
VTDDPHDPAPKAADDEPSIEGTDLGMRTVTTSIAVATLAGMAAGRFGDLVKAVVDVAQGIMVVDADMHADEEALLLEHGSRQRDLWGINLYPGEFGSAAFIEFDSMINIRPSQNNRTRSVDDPQARQAVISVVSRLVKP